MRQIIYGAASALVIAWGIAGPAQAAPATETCAIDFEGLAVGQDITVLSVGSGLSGCSVGGVVTVQSMNGLFDPAAIVFDSANPTGGDIDLGSPNATCPGGGPGVGAGGALGSPYENCVPLGNIAILAENKFDSDGDGLVDDPDDADVPGTLLFDFTDINNKGVNVNHVSVMDIEAAENENPAVITLIRPGKAPAVFAVPNTFENGVATVGRKGIGVKGVTQMRVDFKGSGALVSAIISTREQAGDCWATFGGFESAYNTDPSGQKIYSFGGNVGPPPSGHLNIVNHVNGDHLRISNAVATSCERIEELCPNSGSKSPGPPSGNKDPAAPNILHFVGDGDLNGTAVAASGSLIDCGEPHGKKNRDQDRFIVNVDGGLYFDVELDGGNVQLHGPVGAP